MFDELIKLLGYNIIQNALMASVLASIIAGLIGVIIVEKKLVMMTGGIAHTSYGGVGLGLWLGFEAIIGAFLFAVVAALGIGIINSRLEKLKDVLMAIFWSLGMALGILFVNLAPDYTADVTSYLFGNILTVTSGNLILMLIISVIIVVILLGFYQEWKSHLFDQEFMKIKGRKTKMMENILMILIALAVVVLIRVVGIVLVIAMLSIPAAISGLITKRLEMRMLLSVVFGLVMTVIGIFISYFTDFSSGAVIVVFGVFLYGVVYLIERYIFNKKDLI